MSYLTIESIIKSNSLLIHAVIDMARDICRQFGGDIIIYSYSDNAINTYSDYTIVDFFRRSSGGSQSRLYIKVDVENMLPDLFCRHSAMLDPSIIRNAAAVGQYVSGHHEIPLLVKLSSYRNYSPKCARGDFNYNLLDAGEVDRMCEDVTTILKRVVGNG